MTGISGSGKSSLVAQALPELMMLQLGHEPEDDAVETGAADGPTVIETTGDTSAEMSMLFSVSSRLIRSQSDGRRDRISRLTPAFSIMFESCLPQHQMRGVDVTTQVDSPSTWPRDVVRRAKGRGS